MESNPSSSRTDRKTIERNRRNQMKALSSTLSSLVPHQRPVLQETRSLSDQLDEAAKYIKRLQTNLERMKQKKDGLLAIENPNTGSIQLSRSPQIEVHQMGSALQVVLITGLEFQFMFREMIRMLHEEGADIVHASFNVVEETVFHTIHSKLGDSAPAHEAARVSERLKKFVNDSSSF